MKIDGQQVYLNPPAQRIGTDPAGNSRTAAPSGDASIQDSVELSGDLQLVAKAVAALTGTDDIRPEAVARGKALVASGEIHHDVEGLADAIIDSIVEP